MDKENLVEYIKSLRDRADDALDVSISEDDTNLGLKARIEWEIIIGIIEDLEFFLVR
jgi:hypothetical protein